MSKVYVTTYEIIGAGIALAQEHYRKCDETRTAHWEFVESLGGVGMRPDHNGGVRSVFFKADTAPTGWRKISREGGNIEAVPSRGTKAGKALSDQLAALPRVPMPTELAKTFGYAPNELAMDGERGVIYFPTELRVAHPSGRFFIRLPRFERDGFTPDETMLRAVPESELMKAVEDHNAEAKRQREKEAA